MKCVERALPSSEKYNSAPPKKKSFCKEKLQSAKIKTEGGW